LVVAVRVTYQPVRTVWLPGWRLTVHEAALALPVLICPSPTRRATVASLSRLWLT
jgi:hypothetical protein